MSDVENCEVGEKERASSLGLEDISNWNGSPLREQKPSFDSIIRRRAVHSAELHVDTDDVFSPVAAQRSPDVDGDLGSDCAKNTREKPESLLQIGIGDESLLESEVEDASASPRDYQSVAEQKTAKATLSKTPSAKVSMLDFVWAELSRGYSLENDELRYTEKRRKVYAFIRIPRELERFLAYGFLQCVDAFSYMFTFLPLRFFLALWHALLHPLLGRPLSPSEICDLLKVAMVVAACVLMQYVDTSQMYHLVRGQSVIKLYIFYNMLEVADKLFSSFGQDILDALFWTATEPKSARKYLPHFGTLTHLTIAIIYAFSHAFLVLLQNKALLTIMMSNNFVELKGSVFKKFAKPNLFQMSCSDVRERFHYVILLSIVVVRNMTAVNWKADHFFEMVPDLALVMFGEFFVDWVKHAFITKFNEIPATVYRDFTITIAYDVVKSRDSRAFSDHSDQVSRRMGFIPIPLTILSIRILTQSFDFSTKRGLFLLGLSWMALVTLKILNSIVLLGKASNCVAEYESMQEQAEQLARLRLKKSKSVPASPRMSLVDFSDVMQQNARGGGFTISDLLAHLDELKQHQEHSPIERTPQPDKLPRRSHSVANFGSGPRGRRGTATGAESFPESLTEVEETAERPSDTSANNSEMAQKTSSELSPKRKVRIPSEAEKLAGVQAFSLLNTNEDRIES